MIRTPRYGNWIRKRAIIILWIVTLVLLGLSFIPWHIGWQAVLLALAIVSLLTTLLIMRLYNSFSPSGGNYQQKVYNLIIDTLDWSGKGSVLDIGAGSGALIIEIAKRYPDAVCTGLDFWGKNWEYSQKVCEENADIEGVCDRVKFVRGTASRLPFGDEQFDAVVSNLTFHEVKDTKDKILLIREALRVLKPGGHFSFLDPFFDTSRYGKIEPLRESLDGMGLSQYRLQKVGEVLELNLLLKTGRALGRAGVLYGIK